MTFNGKVFVGRFLNGEDGLHEYWGRAVGQLAPTRADYARLQTAKPVTLDKNTVAVVANGKLLIGRWRDSEDGRHLFWSQAAKL